MAEDQKSSTGRPAPGQDLASKIAKACRAMPAEPLKRPTPDPIDIQNPELDQAFEKMVEKYRLRKPERETPVVAFPGPPTFRVPRPATGDEHECPECGHNNPAGNQFCGMCGAARVDAVPLPPAPNDPEEPAQAVSVEESGVKHHHHHYHHHHYRNNPYLLVAIALLLGMIAWQQWREYRRLPVPAPTTQIQAPVPAQAQPSPNPPAPAAVLAVKPDLPRTPVSPRPTIRSSAQPLHPVQRPLREAKSPDRTPTSAAPPELASSGISSQPLPALPLFSTPPANPRQRVLVSQGTLEGRLLKKVLPVYPAAAWKRGLEGQVVLDAVIGKDGSVGGLQLVSGDPTLAAAAIEAVRQWRYRPYLLNGEPVEIGTRVQVDFQK